MQSKHPQKGLALMMLVFTLTFIAIGYSIFILDTEAIKNQKNRKTELALVQAKNALLAYSTKKITQSRNGPALVCGSNCPRPGDLPCPDIDNDGDADNCNTPAIGRLPWKTIGLGDIRDGENERLWYAVSDRFKNNPRILPLNSESLGTISLRDSQGFLQYDATSNHGLAAVVIAPGRAVVRSDSTVIQNRAAAQQNIATNYLETALGEDNADFVDDSVDGFINGEITIAGQVVLNDIVLPITKREMSTVMETQVLGEVMNALLVNYCIGTPNLSLRSCSSSPSPLYYYPYPADVTDTTCLGNTNLESDLDVPAPAVPDCIADSGVRFGRIPVSGNPYWITVDTNSILRGEASNNWFQQNGWRELIFYAVSDECVEGASSNCDTGGTNYLTLNGSVSPVGASSILNKKIIVISGGADLSGTQRISSQKTNFINYVEGQNATPADNIFQRDILSISNNDYLISVP